MKLSGHCHQHPELAASDLVLWQPNQNLRRGKPSIDFVEVLRQDAGNVTTELHTVTEGRTVCRFVRNNTYSTATSPSECPYQIATSYNLQFLIYIIRIRFYRSRSLEQSERSNQGHIMTSHTYNPQPM